MAVSSFQSVVIEMDPLPELIQNYTAHDCTPTCMAQYVHVQTMHHLATHSLQFLDVHTHTPVHFPTTRVAVYKERPFMEDH